MNCRRPLSIVALATLSLGFAACGDRAIEDLEMQRDLDYGECEWNQSECEGMSCAESLATEATIAIIEDELAQLGMSDSVRITGSVEEGDWVAINLVVDMEWISAPGQVWNGEGYTEEEVREGVRWQVGASAGGSELVDVETVARALASCDPELRIDACHGPMAGDAPSVFAQVEIDECTSSWATVDARTGEVTSCQANFDTCAQDEGWGTPLVLRFDDTPVEMAAAPADASFDIDGDGSCITHDWPTAATPWLALDRDLNGHIDDGSELFGSGTLLPGGERATQGFEALATLDTNGDGRITRQDARFEELVLWADEDGDKLSNFAEMPSASEVGLVSIDLSYRVDPVCDARGNCGVERASFTYLDDSGRLRTGEVVDLHLACQ